MHHGSGGQQHEPGEGDEQDIRVDQFVETRPEQRAADADGPEDESRPPTDTSRAGVADDPGKGCDTDDYQRGGGGLPWVLTDRVDEGRDGEDRPAAAERPQRHADQ
jgi:hypothetical protein